MKPKHTTFCVYTLISIFIYVLVQVPKRQMTLQNNPMQKGGGEGRTGKTEEGKGERGEEKRDKKEHEEEKEEKIFIKIIFCKFSFNQYCI